MVVTKTVFDFRPVLKVVEVPLQVLTAADCEERWRRLPRVETEPARRAMEFKVPDGLEAGASLSIPVGSGEDNVMINVPENAEEGDTLCMTQRADSSWKVVKRTTEHCFTVFDCVPGDTLKMRVPDGRTLSFKIPEGIDLKSLVVVKDGGNGWTFDRFDDLPTIADMPTPDEAIVGPYADLLKLLGQECHLSKLPRDTGGELRVSAPFCGRMSEHEVLCNFLAGACLPLPGIEKIQVMGTEVGDKFGFDWAIAQSWCSQIHPRIKLNMWVQDLAEDPLPLAGLTIGIHPEVTKGGPWFPIIGSILRSASQGICVLACFYETERDTLLNMIEMFKSDGINAEVFENPYYANKELPSCPAMRFIFIISRDALRKVKKVKKGGI